MTREELKAKLEPIVRDPTLTGDQRSEKLSDIAVLWIERPADGSTLDPEILNAKFDEWNWVMVEILDEMKLPKQ